jgi:chemotaxis response regulator CheB
VSGVEHSRACDGLTVLVAVALSAGGLTPLRKLIRSVGSDFTGAIVIAQHVAQYTILPQILGWDTQLRVKLAEQHERLHAATIYVCPAQQHILVNPDATISLSRKARVEYCRPSADWLFRSAAASFGPRTVAIVLSGMLRDGSRGVTDVARAGGLVMAQAPSTCDVPDMPIAAIRTGHVTMVLEPEHLGEAIMRRGRAESVRREAALWEAPFEFDALTA